MTRNQIRGVMRDLDEIGLSHTGDASAREIEELR